MARYRQHFSLLIANILVPVGVVLFIVGFFRGRPPVPKPKGFDINHHAQINLQTAPFDKVIFMMVDALRSDFVYAEGTGFKYTQSLIRSGAAMPFTARAAAPTLTLSRVKALTQGTSQSFLDVWLNVFESESARSLAGADTWLSRLKAERTPEKKMVFYGADLWLDVYSDIFDRFEGTDAWYLPEFTTVDSNVTRHLPNELARDDWKALVLHYLGLDNIAHQGGPTGAHMVPKQAQMDDVVKLVYDALEQKAHLKNTLFVMLGDHGMTDQGNHGGASPSEIAAAMVFVSPKLKLLSSGLASPVPPTKNYEYYSVINQVDFVPTLAGLMGFTTPAKSLGIFVAEFLDLFESSDDRHRVLFNNAQQLKTLLESEYDTTTANVTYCSQLCGQCLNDLDQVLCWLQKADIAQREQTPTNLASMEEVYRITRTFCDHAQRLLNAPPNNPSYVHLAFSAAALVFSTILLWMTHSFSARPSDNGIFAFGLIVSFHGPTMFFNALVLNEQYYWYWASLAWLMYIGYKRLITGEHWLKAIAYPVVLQLISQSLDEATRCGSIVDYVHNMLSGHQVLFWIPGLMIYVSALHSVSRYLGLGSVTSFFASTSICILAILSRLSSAYRLSPTSFDFAPPWLKDLVSGTNRNQSLNIFWGGLGACLIAVVVQSRMGRPISRKATIVGVVELAALYLRSLTRPKYLVLYPIFDLQYQWLSASGTSMTLSEIAVTTLLLGQSAFYASGHSNSFASFDLTNGFNGIETSRAIAVALQALLSNYFAPVWWSLSGLRLLLAWSEAQDIVPHSNLERRLASMMVATNGIAKGNRTSELTEQYLPVKETHTDGYANGHEKSTRNGDRPAAGYTNGHSTGISNGHTNVISERYLSGIANGHDKMVFVAESRNTDDTPLSSLNGSPTITRNAFAEHLTLQTFYTASTSLAVLMACVWKRNDQSIWTVLTPKCLNIILWAVFQQLIVNSVLCTVIWIFVVT